MKSEITYPSIHYLQKSISALFRYKYRRDCAFPNYQCDLLWPTTKTIDVVLFGDAAYSLMCSNSWPATHLFRLWVLNSTFRNGLIEIFNFKRNELGVIPREALILRKKGIDPFPASPDVNFIISSRTRYEKNFILACQTVNFLQENFFGKSSRLYIFSPKTSAKDLKSKLKDLTWYISPHFMGDQGLNWIEFAPANSILVNFSIDPMDDFNVSTAQAQEQGWPLLVPDRGPYRDISSNRTIYLPVDLLKPVSLKQQKVQIEKIALYIMAHWFQPHRNNFQLTFESPVTVDYQRLKELRQNLPKELKKDLLFYPNRETIWGRKVFRKWEGI